MDENEKPFTDSLSTDIVLLSSFLNETSESGWKCSNTRLNFLDHISTILNIGGSVNAVAGNIGPGSIKFIVFTAETARPRQNQQFAIRGPQNCRLQSIIPDSKKGAELLGNWAHYTK